MGPEIEAFSDSRTRRLASLKVCLGENGRTFCGVSAFSLAPSLGAMILDVAAAGPRTTLSIGTQPGPHGNGIPRTW